MGVHVTVRVIPNAKKRLWQLMSDGTIKCYVGAPPERGKANRELLERLAQALNISPGSIHIQRGETAQRKMLFIDADVSQQQILHSLGLSVQQDCL